MGFECLWFSQFLLRCSLVHFSLILVLPLPGSKLSDQHASQLQGWQKRMSVSRGNPRPAPGFSWRPHGALWWGLCDVQLSLSAHALVRAYTWVEQVHGQARCLLGATRDTRCSERAPCPCAGSQGGGEARQALRWSGNDRFSLSPLSLSVGAWGWGRGLTARTCY